MNDQPFHLCFQQVGDANLWFLCFNRIPIAWMRLKASRWLAERILSRFVLCLRNKWSIYFWANDGDWTRAWWIHNPLPWSTWLRPPRKNKPIVSIYSHFFLEEMTRLTFVCGSATSYRGSKQDRWLIPNQLSNKFFGRGPMSNVYW